MTDYTVGDTIYLMFTTRAFATGIPTVLAGTPVVSAYENDSATQITAGITLGVSHDSVVGMNLLTIVATGANGYESGKDYNLVITTGTVDSVSVVGEVVGTFSLGRSAAATNTSGLTFTVANQVDSNVITKTGFSLAATGLDAIASTATGMVEIAKAVWDRALTGATHNIATSAGRRLRALQDFGLYEGGAVWIDTVNGTPGTTDFENGTVSNPVDSIADARTIADSVGLKVFHVLPGSSFTLAAAFDAFEFIGFGYTVALGGQSVSGTVFNNASITGNDDGSNTTATTYNFCLMATNSLGLHKMNQCGFSGTVTLAEAGTYDWVYCYSQVAGTGTPSVDVGALILNTNLNMRNYSGGIEVQNLGGAGTDNVSLEGRGQLVINANCSGGTIAIRGLFTVTDNAGGAVTLSDDARFDTGQINAECDTALADYDGPTNAEMEARTVNAATVAKLEAAGLGTVTGTAITGTLTTTTMTTDLTEATDDHYNGRTVVFTSGALLGQATVITDYTGATKLITMVALTEAPGNTDSFVIV